MRIRGQYIEKEVPVRQESDMVNEMARVMTGLPRYTAYAKIVEENGGEASVWKGRIRTSKLDDVRDDAMDAARAAIEKNMLGYCRPRAQIREEIRLRQERWRRSGRQEPPPVQSGGGKKPEVPGALDSSEDNEPPPQSSRG
jgi:hypothetical protein